MNVRWLDPLKSTRERLLSTWLGGCFAVTYTAVGLLFVFMFWDANAFVLIGSMLLANILLPPISVYVDRVARRFER